jgi:hypothetical protein
MAVTKINRADQTGDVKQPDGEYYLPATVEHSSEPGRVERVLKTVFRRRGDVPFFARYRDQ